MKLTDKLAAAAHVAICPIHDETVLLDKDAGMYFGLDAVGSRLWQLVLEDKTLADACEILASEYDVTRDKLEADVLDLAVELSARRLVSVRGHAAAGP